MDGIRNALKTRTMVIPATANTYYPTGVMLGADWQGNLNADTTTRSTTAGDSYFAQGGNDPAKNGICSIIRSITVITLGGSSPTIAIQSHAGTVLVPAFDAATAKEIRFGQGLFINGGWRIVTVGTPLVVIEWEPVHNRPS